MLHSWPMFSEVGVFRTGIFNTAEVGILDTNETVMKSAGQNIARLAFRFVLIVGIVNFFADMTYQGGRAIVGPFLASLGALRGDRGLRRWIRRTRGVRSPLGLRIFRRQNAPVLGDRGEAGVTNR